MERKLHAGPWFHRGRRRHDKIACAQAVDDFDHAFTGMQSEAHRLPARAAVPRDEHPRLIAGRIAHHLRR